MIAGIILGSVIVKNILICPAPKSSALSSGE